MSVKVQTWVWEHSETNGNDRLVLLSIADEADDDGTNAYPSMERLARKCRVNKATVMRVIRRLEEQNEISVVRPDEYGRGRYNVYTVLMGRVTECNPSEASTKVPEKTGEKVAEGRVMVAEGRAQMPPDPMTPRPLDPESEPSTELALVVVDATADRFDEFWAAYPRKDEKKKGRAAWDKAIKREHPDVIIAAAARYSADPNRVPQFTKQPPSWLNGDCWENGPLPDRNGGRAPTRHGRSLEALANVAERIIGSEQQALQR